MYDSYMQSFSNFWALIVVEHACEKKGHNQELHCCGCPKLIGLPGEECWPGSRMSLEADGPGVPASTAAKVAGACCLSEWRSRRSGKAVSISILNVKELAPRLGTFFMQSFVNITR